MITLAYQPTSDLIWYANYLEDLEPGAVDEDGVMSKPLVSKQIELGVRKNWGGTIHHHIQPLSTLSTGNKLLVKQLITIRVKPENSKGKERNRGIEFNLYANLIEWSLTPESRHQL